MITDSRASPNDPEFQRISLVDARARDVTLAGNLEFSKKNLVSRVQDLVIRTNLNTQF